jgi:hypothetical protein
MTSILAPTNGKPCAESSTTFGAKASLPANQGLTVWRSEDGTSMDCGAISARICADTIWLAIVEALLVQGAEAQRAAEHRAPRERQAVLLRSGSPPTLAMRWTARPLPGPHAGYRGARRAPRLVEPSRVPSRSFAFIPGGERRIPKRRVLSDLTLVAAALSPFCRVSGISLPDNQFFGHLSSARPKNHSL